MWQNISNVFNWIINRLYFEPLDFTHVTQAYNFIRFNLYYILGLVNECFRATIKEVSNTFIIWEIVKF